MVPLVSFHSVFFSIGWLILWLSFGHFRSGWYIFSCAGTKLDWNIQDEVEWPNCKDCWKSLLWCCRSIFSLMQWFHWLFFTFVKICLSKSNSLSIQTPRSFSALTFIKLTPFRANSVVGKIWPDEKEFRDGIVGLGRISLLSCFFYLSIFRLTILVGKQYFLNMVHFVMIPLHCQCLKYQQFCQLIFLTLASCLY